MPRPEGPLDTDRGSPSLSRRILVVDDDESVRSMATRMLRALGHEATSAADGEQGLAYYREHASEIDLVLLDLTMPVMDGCTCFRHMREVNPDVRVVLSTGEPGRREVREVLEEGALGLLRKPYTVSQLAEALDNALQARPS